jgi:hypothetical protein
MGWEHRGNRLYYYRKRRAGQRVVTEYIGSGMAGSLIAELDHDEYLERAYSAAEWKEQQNEQKRIESYMDKMQESINSVVRAVFLTSGYHAHKGQWRKIRHG